MDYAFTSENKLILASDAFEHGGYECPVCRGKLSYHPGKINKPHFRHKEDVPKAIKQACENYIPNSLAFNYFEQEELANQQVRLTITPHNSGYYFSLCFPSIEEKLTSRVIYDDLYFNYYCEELKDFILNNKSLLYSINTGIIKVSLNEVYTFTCDNPKLEKILNLQISGKYEPFRNGPLLFKNIHGKYKSIHYRQLTLEGRFLVASKSRLKNIPKNIEVISSTEINKLYVYDLIMPESLDEMLTDWFSKELHYTVLPSTSNLDLIRPFRFKKIGTTYEVTSEDCALLYTSKGTRVENPVICIMLPSGEVNRVRPSQEGIISLKLATIGDYRLIVEAGTSELYTIKKVEEITNNVSDSKYFTVDYENHSFNSKIIYGDSFEVNSNLPFNLHNHSEIGYSFNLGGSHLVEAPATLYIPRICRFELRNQLQEEASKNINWGTILQIFMTSNKYPKRVYNRHLMKKFKKELQKSEYMHREFLLSLIRKQNVYIPEPLINELEKLR